MKRTAVIAPNSKRYLMKRPPPQAAKNVPRAA
jgi:hypothetical protein